MKHNREAHRIGRPTTKFNRDGEAGPCRRPHWVCKGSPSTREARHRQYNDALGSRPTPETRWNTTGKPVEREAHDEVQYERGGRSTPETPMGV